MTRNTLHESRWFSIRQAEDGEEYLASTGDEVLIVPLNAAGEVLLGVEPSAAFGEPTMILPGGQVEPGVSNDEQANRELQEELGFRAGRVDFLGELLPWSKYLAVRSFIYLGRDLSASRLEGDEGYDIGVQTAPLAAFEELIASGRLRDARAIAGLFLARSLVAREPG